MYTETRALIQIYTGEFGHIIIISSDNEEVLKQIAHSLRNAPYIEGPNNYIGTPALSLYDTAGRLTSVAPEQPISRRKRNLFGFIETTLVDWLNRKSAGR